MVEWAIIEIFNDFAEYSFRRYRAALDAFS